MQIKSFIIPAFYAYYLTYGESDGLTQKEIAALNRFIKDNDLKGGHWSIPNDNVSFTEWHDMKSYGILAADCIPINYVVLK